MVQHAERQEGSVEGCESPDAHPERHELPQVPSPSLALTFELETEEDRAEDDALAERTGSVAIGSFLLMLFVILGLLAIFRVAMQREHYRPTILGLDEERVCSPAFIVSS